MKPFITRSATALMLFTAACSWGTRPEHVAPAIGPPGARIAVRVRGEETDRVGELFAVDSVGVFMRGSTLMRISWTRLAAMDVKDMGSAYDVSFGESVTPAKRAKLAPLTRFPQGLDPALLRTVLSTIGQSTLEEVR